jgi:N-acetylglucosamine malate deacetylase 1
MFLNAAGKSWLDFVEGFANLYKVGLEIAGQDATVQELSVKASSESAPRVIICSPHPDDEMLSGALALRLRRHGALVLVLALSLGSNPARKTARREELAAACRKAGFAWRLAVEPLAFPVLRPELEQQPTLWRRMLAELDHHFERERPALVLAPHALDGHPAHRAAHRLVSQALRRHSRSRRCKVLLAETEYWHPMQEANLLLGVESEELALLLGALACHRGEIARHPYHLRQPARMMDNVRRGSEMLSGFGENTSPFLFGELYRLSKVVGGRLFPLPGKKVFMPGEKIEPADL